MAHMITKQDAIAACEKIEDFFAQFSTGRFDRGDHTLYNESIDESQTMSRNLLIRVRNQVKFGEL